LGLLTLVVDRRISAYFLRIYSTVPSSADAQHDSTKSAPKLQFQCELPYSADYQAPYHHFHTLELSARLVGFSFAADEAANNSSSAIHIVNASKASFIRAEAFHAAVLQYSPTPLAQQVSLLGYLLLFDTLSLVLD
jgi:hypothetical protein